MGGLTPAVCDRDRRRGLLAVRRFLPDGGDRMKTVNAFNWREFVQPVVTVPECLKRGQPTQFLTAPRTVVRGDAMDQRLTLNSAGRLVSTPMWSNKPSLCVAIDADRKVIRKRGAAI